MTLSPNPLLLEAFKDEYKTKFQARPDVDEGELLKVTDWKLLTPKESGARERKRCDSADGYSYLYIQLYVYIYIYI